MSHKPNLLSWDQDVAASPREFHETDNNRTNSAALLATWQYFSFRHIWFSKLLSHQKLSKLFFPIFQMLCHSSKAKEVSRSPENYHLLQKWRTRKLPAILKNIDVWRDVTLVVMSRPMFTLDAPSLLVSSHHSCPKKERHARVNRCEASADEAILILSYCLPYGSLLKQCQYKSKERFPFFEDSSHK